MEKSKKNKKYDFLNAPVSKDFIADYENIFTNKEHNNLLKIIKRIEDKYKIKIFVLTVTSFNNFKGEDVYYEKVFKIFNINHIKDKTLIFEFSEKEHKFSYNFSNEFQKIIGEDNLDNFIAKISSKYFDSRKYYQAFKEMLEAIEQELQKSII